MADTRDAGATNHIEMATRLLERESLRYTPGGVAVCTALVEHESTQSEAGVPRTVRLVINARFSGRLAQQVADEPLGSALLLRGFIAAKRLFRDGKPSGSLQIHVEDYRAMPNEASAPGSEPNQLKD